MNIVTSTFLPFRFSNVTTANLTSSSFSAYEFPSEIGAITMKLKLNMANSNIDTPFMIE